MAEQQATATAAAPSPAPTGQTGAAAAPAQAATNSGQGMTAAPVTGKAVAAPAGGEARAADASAQQVTEAPSWGDDDLKWMQSKGYDPTGFDPANDAHRKVVQSYRNAESELTRRMQAEKAKEVLETTKPIVDQPGPDAQKELSPLEEWEQVFEFDVGRILMGAGVQSVQELYDTNPRLYAQLEQRQVAERQAAWEKTQEWKAETAQKAEKQRKEEERYARQMQQAKDYTAQVLNDLRTKNPKLDDHFKAAGVNDILSHLEEVRALPKEILFLEPKMAAFLAQAADAIAYKNDEPARYEKWQQEYEKKKAGIAAASAPAPAGAATASIPKPFIVGKSAGDRLDAAKLLRK
jgi:hypothetical protein